jgi:hypothetical protein
MDVRDAYRLKSERVKGSDYTEVSCVEESSIWGLKNWTSEGVGRSPLLHDCFDYPAVHLHMFFLDSM